MFKIVIRLVLIIPFLLIIAGAAVFVYFAKDLPDPQKLNNIKVSESTKILDRNGILLYEIHGEEKRTIVASDKISQYLKDATVAVEDKNFYGHFGIDPKAILRVAWNYLFHKTIQGGSTITQQFIKNSFLTQERSLTRKIKEMILAVELERRYSKSQILEFYLNQIPYGSNSYGVEAAAKNFLGKPAADLDLAESAFLAALPKAPTYYSPYGSHLDGLEKRKNFILDQMEGIGFISSAEKEKAKKEKVAVRPRHESILAPHFVNFVKDYLSEKYGDQTLENDGLKVYTTLDYQLQKQAEEIVKKYAKINLQYNAKNAALITLDSKTGQILTMVGSKDYWDLANDGNVNVITRERQPGSSFKPFVYATAFQKGYAPDTKVFDLPTEFIPDNPNCPPIIDLNKEEEAKNKDCYHPKNYDGKFRGPVTLREALAQSLNVPAVKVLYLSGLNDVLKTAANVGITTLNDPSRFGLSLVLGGGEVKPLELAQAYGVLSQEGNFISATSILKIENSNGKILEDFPAPKGRGLASGGEKKKKVLEPQITRLVTNILTDNNARTPAFGLNSPLFFENYQVAVKTGTTQGDNFDENRDGWTMGYTPSFVVGVWVGNNDNTPFKKLPGVMVAAPMFHEMMETLLKNKPVENFTPPDPIEIDPSKSFLQGKFEEETIIKIDKISGKLATALTPSELIEERKFVQPHDLIYFVNKNDPQTKNWEASVAVWAKEHSYFTLVPVEGTDDIHTLENKPQIVITLPQNGAVISDKKIIFNTQVSGNFPIKEVDFFLDDIFIGSDISSPYGLSYTIKKEIIFEPNFSHVLRAKVYDKVGNTNEAQVDVIIQ